MPPTALQASEAQVSKTYKVLHNPQGSKASGIFFRSTASQPRRGLVFDTDSHQILVNNGATHSFTNDEFDFVEPMTTMRTIMLEIEDDQGNVT
jgi:hypothetical protein